jgi:cytochrome c biogenesis protein CcmG, thiol:disulfide interchange protein DsbE
MRKWRLLGLFVLFLVSALAAVQVAAQSKQASASLVGKRAPAFKVKDLNGVTRTLSDYQGKIVLLNFSATWCGPCRMEAAHLERGWDYYRKRGVAVVTVLTADRGDIMANGRGWRDRFRLTFPVLVDTDDTARKRYQVRSFPTNLIIDARGIVRYHEPGFDPAALDGMLNRVIQARKN